MTIVVTDNAFGVTTLANVTDEQCNLWSDLLWQKGVMDSIVIGLLL